MQFGWGLRLGCAFREDMVRAYIRFLFWEFLNAEMVKYVESSSVEYNTKNYELSVSK